MYNLVKTRLKIAENILPHLPAKFLTWPFSGILLVEPTNMCNFKCPLCPTPTMKREKGMMSYTDFRQIMANTDVKVKQIAFNWAGEPLLNPDLWQMIAFANQKGIRTTASTNASMLHKYYKEIFDSGLSALRFSIDGATQETYSKFRVGGDFPRILQSIKEICAIKKEHGYDRPEFVIQMIVTRDTEKEILAMRELANNLGVDYLRFKTLSLGSMSSSVQRQERAKTWLPQNMQLSRYDQDLRVKNQSTLCAWLRKSVILWNGDVAVCCHDYEATMRFGNLKTDLFSDIWNGERAKQLRHDIVRKRPVVCQNCQVPIKGGNI